MRNPDVNPILGPRKRPKVFSPFPDAVQPGYKVVPGTGSVSFSEKVMRVPLTAGDEERFTRLHEMLHLRLTPPEDPRNVAAREGITMESLQACEDGRINLAGEGVFGLPMSKLGAAEDLSAFPKQLEKMLARDYGDALLQCCRHYVAFQGRAAGKLRDAIRSVSRELWRDVRDLTAQAVDVLTPADGQPATFAATVEAARILDRQVPSYANAKQAVKDSPADLGKMVKLVDTDDMVPWGSMAVSEPQRSARHGAKVSPQFQSSLTGPRVRRVSRVVSDGRIFARKIPQQGGSLLIDGSGSMSLSPEDVQAILTVAPTAWVAIYGGHYDGRGNLNCGTVKVLAKDGKAVAPSDMASPGGGNVIDGPALELLARQSQPRLWICDGYVTGIGDRVGRDNIVEAAKICTRAQIVRYDDVSEAIAALAKLGKAR